MQFNISFKTIFEYILKKLVLCIQIRFVSTEKTTRIASRASCLVLYCIPCLQGETLIKNPSIYLSIYNFTPVHYQQRKYISFLKIAICRAHKSQKCQNIY